MTSIQWNCNGFYAHREEIRLLTSDFNPVILCLQETRFKITDTPNFRNYTFYRNDNEMGEIACGGVAIAVRNDHYAEEVSVHTPLQAVVVETYLPQRTALCNIYLPPSEAVTERILVNLLSQLTRPFIVYGDFNAKNILWGGDLVDSRGRVLEKICTDLNLVILNNGDSTHFSSGPGSFSAIDLTFCSPSVALNYDWGVHPDLCSSDHFPIILKPTAPAGGELKHRKWKINNADWPHFRELAVFSQDDLPNIEEHTDYITEVIIKAAEKSIPKTSGKSRIAPAPWWNNDCKEAIKKRRKALNNFEKYPTQTNLSAFRILRAKARFTIRQARKSSWMNYVSTINRSTHTTKVWDKVKKISGKHVSIGIPGIMENGSLQTSTENIANALGRHFSHVSSSDNYSETFLLVKDREEARSLNFGAATDENYNLPFSLWELKSSIAGSRDTAPGPDSIHNQMLKNLPEAALKHILLLYNRIWTEQDFPRSWQSATLIAIPKPGKDKKHAINYRPISLTSCLCKILERMVNKRLIWMLEKENLIAAGQSGFRRNRSTLDHLVYLEALAQDTFLSKQQLLAVFFDLEKAYDTTWRYGILRQLYEWGFKGHLPKFVANFLNNRDFRVRVGSYESVPFVLENGVPQGSVLSCSLFLIAINGIAQCVQRPVNYSLFVDDLAIFFRSPRLSTAERQIQLTINRLIRWADQTGFRFSASKTTCVNFHRLRGLHAPPTLTMAGTNIYVSEKVNFLGLVFDEKLSWRPHLSQLKIKCTSSLNILKILSCTAWGADRVVMLRLYRALIRSRLDYGSIVYSSARPSYTKTIDPVHNNGIRLSLGAFRTSPIDSMYSESGEPSLESRRHYLICSFLCKLRSTPDNPTYKTVFHPAYSATYNIRSRSTRPLGIRAREILANLGVEMPDISEIGWPDTAPWTVAKPACLLQLTQFPKATTPSVVYQQNFLRLLSFYPDFTTIFTDGSKLDNSVGCSFNVGHTSTCFKLNPNASVFTAELYAFLRALLFIQSDNRNCFLICSDSLSSLQALERFFPIDSLSQQIQTILTELKARGTKVALCWIPGHVGIVGNERADAAAKRATTKTHIDFNKIPASDAKGLLKQTLWKRWQTSWEAVKNNKLRTIKPNVRVWASSSRRSRREEVVTARMRLGHSRITHGFLLNREDPPSCDVCSQPVTVKHILIECPKYRATRRLLDMPQELQEILADSQEAVDRLITFLKDTDLYDKV